MKRIPLRNRAGETVAEALVDDADFEWLSQRRWRRTSAGYVGRRQGYFVDEDEAGRVAVDFRRQHMPFATD